MSVAEPLFARRAIDLACALQQIPSPTFHEERKAQEILRRFQSLGLEDVAIDAAGNVLGRIRGREPGRPLIFSAHMDTVFPADAPLTLETAPDRIAGPSIGDNSLGLDGLLLIPEMLQSLSRQPRGDVWLAATTCEEGLGDLRGIRAVAERFGAQATAYISIEGMGLGVIIHRGLGVERFRVTVRTAGGHSWVDYGAPSAVHSLAILAAKLADLRLPKKPRTTFNIGLIHGGTSINTIAAHAWMELDLRSESPQQLADLSAQVRGLVESARRGAASITLEQIGYRPPGELSQTHPLVQKAIQIAVQLGLAARLEIASTEANLPLSLGFPALTLGISTGDHAHSQVEYINTEGIEKGLLQLIRIIETGWD